MTSYFSSHSLAGLSRRMQKHRAGPLLLVTLLYGVLTLIMTHPIPWNLSAGIVGQAGDAYQHLWAYWWAKTALFDFHTTFADLSMLYFPQGAEHPILWVTPMIQFIGLPFTLLFGPIVSYNLVFLFSILFSGVTTYLLAYEVSGNHKAAFIGGLIFAFAPTRFMHGLGHHAQTITFLFPLYAFLLIRTLKEPGLKISVLTGIALAAASLVNFMHLALVVIPMTLIVVGHFAWTRWSDFWKLRRFGSLALTATVAFVLTSPFFLPFIQAQLNGTPNNLKSPGVTEYGADLLAFITPAPSHPLLDYAPELRHVFHQITAIGYTQQNIVEGIIYVGIIPLLLAIWGIWRNRQKAGPWLVLFLVTAVLSLGPLLKINGELITYRADDIISYIPLPYAILTKLPFYEAVRTPSRFNTTTMLALAVLVSLGVATVLNRIDRRSRAAYGLIALLTPLILFEYTTIWPMPMAETPVPAFYEEVAQEPGYFGVLDYPMYLQPVSEDHSFDFPMYYQLVHGKPIAGGYIWRLPAGVEGTMRSLQNLVATDRRADIVPTTPPEKRAEILRLLNFRYVIVHKQDTQFRRTPMPDARLQEIRQDLQGFLGEPVYEDTYILAFQVPDGSVPADMQLLTLGKNWGTLEIVDNLPWRWTEGQFSTIVVSGTSDSPRRLSFRVRSVEGPRTIRLLVNGAPLGEMTVENGRQFMSPPFTLPRDQNEIRLEVDTTCVRGAADDAEESEAPCRNLQLTEIELVSATNEWGETSIGCTFDNGIELLGYDLSRERVASGGSVDVTLYWQANRPVEQSFTVFTHLLDREGNLLAQKDNPPQFGTYPTDWWMPGEIVTDSYTIAIPADYQGPENTFLVAGFYLWPSGARSGVDRSCFGASPDGYLELSQIEITGEP